MKKKCLFIAVLFYSLISFGQQPPTSLSMFSKIETLKAQAPNTSLSKDAKTNNKLMAPGDVIWSEDFTGGFPLGWTVLDNTGNSFDWVLNTSTANLIADFTNTPPIASTSGGNHMLLFGDSYNTSGGTTEMDAYFQTSGIALTGQPNITIKFQQALRLCCGSNAQLDLLVSTDSTFTTNVQTFDVRNGLAINSASADPERVSINITSIAGGVVGDIFLRFHWVSGASHYYWMIDDIEISESADNDLVVNSPYYGFSGQPYTRIPRSHVQPIDFSILVDNVGGADQPNTILTVEDNGVVVATGSPNTILVGSSDSLTGSSYTPLLLTGVIHNLTLSVNSDSIDATQSNNIMSFNPFEITDTVYATDDFGLNGVGVRGGTSLGVNEFEAGNFFDAVVNDTATSITVVIGSNTVTGTVIDFALYEFDSTSNFIEIARSNFYTVATFDPGNALTLPFNISGPVLLDAGKRYFAAVRTFSEFYYGTSGTSPNTSNLEEATSLIAYPSLSFPNLNQLYVETETPMVRLNVSGASFCIGGTSTDVRTECAGYIWIDGNTYLTSNSAATYIIPNGAANGCDSVISLDLTINNTIGIDSLAFCGSFGVTWIDGNVYTSNNNTAIHTIPNGSANGCDSIVQLHLTFNNINANYSYVNNGNGNYSFINNSTGNFNMTQWVYGDGSSSIGLNANHTFIANGIYVAAMFVADTTNGWGCFDYYIDTLNVTGVLNPVQCNAAYVAYTDTISNTVIVVNSSIGNGLSYLWDFGDGNTSTLAYPNYTYSTAGPFYLCITIDDGNGCIDQFCDSIGSNGTVFKQTGFAISIVAPPIITGIDDEVTQIQDVNIYPNPTSSQLSINSSNLIIDEINIIDITGKMMQKFAVNENTIDVSNLSVGIYFIKLISGEKIIMKKFIKE